MKTQRTSNFELLRILMMIGILLYHLMIYNGVVYIPENEFTVPGLLICSGSAIVADYAFMSLTAYFMIDKKPRPVRRKLIQIFCQVLFMYAIKNIVLFGVLGYQRDVGFYTDFFINGSWWFIYVYLVILIATPVLNRIIYECKLRHLQFICASFAIWFIMNGITNDVNLLNDFIGFLLVYFIIGYLKRTEFNIIDKRKCSKKYMLLIILLGYIITFLSTYLIRISEEEFYVSNANDMIQHLVGKYSLIQFVMGISLFLVFRQIEIPYNKWINCLAKNMLYVFLLHETVLAVFWKYGYLRTIDNELPFSNGIDFVLSCLSYIVLVFIFAIVARLIYEQVFGKIVANLKE